MVFFVCLIIYLFIYFTTFIIQSENLGQLSCLIWSSKLRPEYYLHEHLPAQIRLQSNLAWNRSEEQHPWVQVGAWIFLVNFPLFSSCTGNQDVGKLFPTSWMCSRWPGIWASLGLQSQNKVCRAILQKEQNLGLWNDSSGLSQFEQFWDMMI